MCQGTLSNLLGFGDLCLESFDFIRPQLPKHIGAPVVSGPGVYDAVLDLFLSRFDNQVLLGDVLFEVFDRIGIDVFQTGTFGFEKPVYFFRVDLYGVAVFIDSADCPGVGIGEFFGDGFEPLMFVGIQFGFAAERFVLRNQRRDGAFQRGHPVELLVELVYEGFAGPDQFGDAFNQPGDPVDYGLYESLAVVEGEHQSLPCALQEFYRPFDRVQPLFLYAFEFSINILQAVAEFSHRAGSPQERVERRHAALVGQVECFGKVDTFGVEPLEAVDQVRQGAYGLAEFLGELPVCIGEVEQDVAGRRRGARCVEAAVCKGSEQGDGILNVEPERFGHRPDDRHGGLQILEREGGLVAPYDHRRQYVIRLGYILVEGPKRCAGQRRGFRKICSDSRGELQHGFCHLQDLRLVEAQLGQFGLQVRDLGCGVFGRPSEF